MNKHAAEILIRPRITEKAAYQTSKGCYVFNVSPDANKQEIARAIREIYKVTPRKVTVATLPRKAVWVRGTNRFGKTTGGKKAYVYLKQGETIELA
jgi:large subunit ribosomal protein L23